MNRTKRNRLLATSAAGGLMLAAAVPAMASLGGGSSFVNLAYSAWCQNSHRCSYASVGSGAGINGFINQTYDWGASDAPMPATAVQSLHNAMPGQGVKYFATLLGAVAIPTHINGVTRPLNFTGSTLAQIFDGSITKWNNRAIAKTNPGVRFPNATIVECVRSDGSGTSYNFSNFLAKSNRTFKAHVGVSLLPNWSGTVSKGLHNPGVAGCVQTNSNSIGYVDLGDGINAGLKNFAHVAHYEGRKLKYIAPSLATIAAAGNSSSLNVANPVALQLALLGSKNPNAYPITITSFVLAFSNYKNPSLHNGAAKLAAVKGFLNYAYRPSSQKLLATFHFSKLPPKLLALEKKQLTGVK